MREENMKKLLALILSAVLSFSVITAIAEEDVYSDTSNWKIECSSQISESRGILKAFDSDESTIWHSAYEAEGSEIVSQDKPPYTITVTFDKALSVTGVRYIPRQISSDDDSSVGIWQKAEFYGSADGSSFKKIGEGSYSDEVAMSRETVDTKVAEGTYKAIRIIVKAAKGNFGSAAEIKFLSGSVKETPGAKTDAQKGSEKAAGTWTVSASSAYPSPKRDIIKAFDSDESTIWHSAYKAEGGEIVSQDKPPYTITVTFDKALSVSGVRYLPRQISGDDNSSVGTWEKAEFYGSADGKSYKKIGEKTYSDLSETRLSEDAAVSKGSYKSIKITIKAAKGNFGSAAEIKFLSGSEVIVPESVKSGTLTVSPESGKAKKDEAGKDESELVSTADAVITASSQRGESVKRAFDSDKTTYWHSNYTDENGIVTSTDPAPYMINVTFPSPVLISGFTYLPRQDASSGRFTEAELYSSESETGDLTLLKTLEYGADAGEKKADFGANIQVRRIEIKITKSGGVATAAEFGFIKGKDSYKTIKTQDFAAHEEATKLYKIDSSAFTVTSDKKHWLGYIESNVTDSSKSTFWQTESGEKEPFTLTIDMKKAYTVREFTYTPRPTDDFHGSWLEFRVESSDNGTDFKKVLSVTGWKEGADEKRVAFPEPVTARYIRFVITKGYTGRAAAADISFYQSKEDSEKNNEPSEKYVLKIGSNGIMTEKGGQKSNVTIDVAPYIDPSSSSTLIPLRGLLEQMGAKVTWDGETEGITIDSGSGKIKMQIQNSLVYADHPVYGTVRYTLAVVPKIRNSRTFIPLRFVSEQLGYNVEWDGESRTITITK